MQRRTIAAGMNTGLVFAALALTPPGAHAAMTESSHAQPTGLHSPKISFKPGTLGVGMEVSVGLTRTFALRAGGYLFRQGFNSTIDSIRYDADVDLNSGAVYADWHPFANGFRVSAGVAYNGNKAKVNALSAESYNIGGTEYTPEDIGSLNGDVTFREVAPYLGLGWGRAPDSVSGFSWTVDAGVLFQGKPRVDLSSANGLLSESEQLRADIEAEVDNVREDVEKFRYYPVLQLGVMYSF